MTKIELMENYTAEQLAEMVIEAYEREDYPKIMAININGFPKMFTIKEIEEIVTAYEEIKLCQEQNKQCKTILPSEYLKVLSLNQTVSQLQSKVEKYRKAFEDAKKERDCRIAEYQNRADKDKAELERAKNTINQINDILEKLFGVRHDMVGKLDEFEKILKQKAESYNTIADYLCGEPISVAQTLISAKRSYELNEEEKQRNGLEKGYYHIFNVSELRQIAEHLLIYCNHYKE